jgi:hypothetical protein
MAPKQHVSGERTSHPAKVANAWLNRLLLPLEPSQFLLDQIEIHHKYDEPKESPHQRYAYQQE